MTNISRRDVLHLLSQAALALAGFIGLTGLLRYLAFQSDPGPQTEFDLGPASNYLPGTRTMLPQVPALLIHDENGFRAISLVCTHLGCTVEQKENGFLCPCHGSRYDREGHVLQGPARQPLRSLNVEITTEGNLRLSLK